MTLANSWRSKSHLQIRITWSDYDVDVTQLIGARIPNVMLGLRRTVHGMVGFHGQGVLVLEHHLALSRQNDQDFFILTSAVLPD